jgi:glycosyltransferase involved in cell wall biosynthesis
MVEKGLFEIIIVNDGSYDNTENVLEKFKLVENIVIIDNKINIGLPRSLNKAILDSKGQYYVRVDADDYVDREFIFYLTKFLDFNPEFGGTFVDYYEVDEKEEKSLRKDGYIDEIACGVMYRSELIEGLGLYDVNFEMREGHELRKRFISTHKLLHIRLPLYNYFKHDFNRTKVSSEELSHYDEKINSQ